MRRIKFRGLRTDGLGWAYGSLCPDRDGDPNIIMPLPWPPIFRFKVKPDTIGQFTGLYDRNGVEVYEGDLVEISLLTRVVRYSDKYATFTLNRLVTNRIDVYNINSKVITVTGNVHEQ